MRITALLGVLLVATSAAMLPVSQALSQTAWKPIKPVKLVVPYAPGGGTDLAVRIISEKLSRALGQPVIIDNRVGANGIVAQDLVFNATPDGHTLMVGTADTQAINPLVLSTVRHDPAAMAAVAPLANMSLMMCGSRTGFAKDIPELVQQARTTSMNYAHWGIGGIGHLGMEAFKISAKLKDLQGVPYQGSAPGLTAVLGGQVSLMLFPMPVALANSDKLNCYAVVSKQRFAGAKDVPTLAEMGYELNVDSYVGIFAPPNTSKAALETLHKAFSEVMSDPEVRKRYLDAGMNAQVTNTAEEYAAVIREDTARWKKIVRDSGVKFDK